MSTLGKVLLVFVFLASIGLFYLAARTLKTIHVHRSIANAFQRAVDDREAKIIKLEGIHDNQESNQANILKVTREMNTWFINRGRVWFDCVLSAKNGTEITVTVSNPTPPGIVRMGQKNLLYVFEHAAEGQAGTGIRDAGGRVLRYLGEFAVDDAQDPASQQVKMTAARALTARQQQVLAAAPVQGTLALYEQMPIDIHQVWASTKKMHGDENLPQFFDFSSIDQAMGDELLTEFRRDMGPAQADDPGGRILLELKFVKDAAELTQAELQELGQLGFNVVARITAAGDQLRDEQGNPINVDIKEIIKKDAIAYFIKESPDGTKKGAGDRLLELGIAQEQARYYQRPLRDYGLLFREYYRQYPILETRKRDLTFAIARVNREKMQTEGNQKAALALQAELKTEQGTLGRERTVVTGLQDELRRQLDLVRKRIQEIEEANQKLAQKLREAQLQHAARINREARVRTAQPGAAKP